VTTGRTV